VGQTLQLLGNAGVIVGILLLVYELNQNRQMMRAQTRNALSEQLVDIVLNDANSQELTEINLKAAAGEALTPTEASRYYSRWVANFRYWENVNYQYRNGLFDDEEYSGHREAWREILSTPRARDLWCQRRNRQSAGFRAEIDDLLGANKCD